MYCNNNTHYIYIMSEKSQHKNILITVACSTAVIAAVAAIGALSLKQEPETIQGQVEVSEYRVSSKVPGRILELRVKEGDYVNVGDTLAILDAPEVRAKDGTSSIGRECCKRNGRNG